MRKALEVLVTHKGLEHVLMCPRSKLRNNIGPREALARLFARDSVHGPYPEPVMVEDHTMIVGGRRIVMLSEPEAKALPWRELGIDVVANPPASSPSERNRPSTSKPERAAS